MHAFRNFFFEKEYDFLTLLKYFFIGTFDFNICRIILINFFLILDNLPVLRARSVIDSVFIFKACSPYVIKS